MCVVPPLSVLYPHGTNKHISLLYIKHAHDTDSCCRQLHIKTNKLFSTTPEHKVRKNWCVRRHGTDASVCPKYRDNFFILLSPRMLKSARRHSAVILTFTINGLCEIHPVIHLLFNPFKPKRRPLYLKPQSVPCCKHFSSGL